MKKLAIMIVFVLLLSLGWTKPQVDAAGQEITSANEAYLNANYKQLYPEDINPPEACGVPLSVPYAQDVEMMLGPWGGANPLRAFDQPATWNPAGNITGATASKDMEIVALTTDDLMAVWRDTSGFIQYAKWGAKTGWGATTALSAEAADGKPALLSRGPMHWAVFARFNQEIRVREWYMGTLLPWKGVADVHINDAASDPVVVSRHSGHMAIFYKTATNDVKFTEWEGAWMTQPVSLGQPPAGAASKGTFAIASELSAISRSDIQMAVFGVDAAGQLWYRERLTPNELDWSDTAWIKLLAGVAISKPAVTSMHTNHIGVVVKDSGGQPYYTRWSWKPPEKVYLPLVKRAGPAGKQASIQSSVPVFTAPYGWSTPVAVGSATFAAPITLAPRGVNALVALGIQADNNLYEAVWTENGGWGNWQAIAGAGNMAPTQVVAAVMRRVNDVLLIGRYDNNQAWSKHYTNLNKTVSDTALGTPREGSPRAQALAFVNGKGLWVSLTRQESSGAWQAEARQISTGDSASLALEHADSGQTTDRVSIATADLDVDGASEVVVATLQANHLNIDISVLEFSFPDSGTPAISATRLFPAWPALNGEDVNVAVGDLDGDQFQNDVVIGYRSGTSAMRFGFFHYGENGLAIQGTTTQINYKDWCGGGGCTVGAHDLEITIGKVAKEIEAPQKREQLVILDVAQVNKPGLTYAQDWIAVRHWITETGNLDPVKECNILTPAAPGSASSIAGSPYAADLRTADMNSGGLENIIYTFGDRLAAITDLTTCDYQELTGLPDKERSLGIGDIDTDGRNEATISYRDAASTTSALFEMVEGNALRTSAQRTVSGSYVMLASDVDNDTRVAELAGCKTFAETKVVAVVNGPPRWYDANGPIQSSGGEYGRTETGGGGTSDGTTLNLGASFSLGIETEINVPIVAIKAGEFRFQATYDFMKSMGTTINTVHATTQEMGYEYESNSLGMVVYNSTEFTCYYYDIYLPSQPEAKNRAMMCKPTGRVSAEDFKPLEDWHSPSFKQAAGPSWVDVGHRSPGGVHTNNLEVQGNYPYTLPVDAGRVKYTWDKFSPVKVSRSSIGGFTNYWHISDMLGGETEHIRSSEDNVTLSAGLTAWGFTFDTSGTLGFGHEFSSVTSWESTLEMGGAVEKFTADRPCYDIIPYVYKARAKTAAGVVYDYLELDYYLYAAPYPCAKNKESGQVFGFKLPFP